MLAILLTGALVVASAGAAGACRKGWLDRQSLVILATMLVPCVLLARYDIDYATWIADRPYWLILHLQALVIVASGAVLLSRRIAVGAPALPVLKWAMVLAAILLATPAGKYLLWPSAGLESFDVGALAQSMALFLLPLLAGLLLTLNVKADDEAMERLLRVVAVLTCLVGLANIASGLFRPLFEAMAETTKAQQAGRSFTPLGDAIPNSLVLYAGYVLCLSRALARRQQRWLYLAACALAAIGIVFTLTRTTLAVLVVTSLWQVARSRHRAIAIASILVSLAVAGVVLRYSPPSFELSRLTVASDGSTDMRQQTLEASFELALRSPIFGQGFGQVYDQFFYRCGRWTPEMQNIQGVWSAREPHSAYMLLWVEGGVMAVAGFGALLWAVLRGLRPPAGAEPLQRELLTGFRGMVAGIAVLAVVGSHLLINYRVAWVCWTLIGIGLAYRRHVDRSSAQAAPIAPPANPGPL